MDHTVAILLSLNLVDLFTQDFLTRQTPWEMVYSVWEGLINGTECFIEKIASSVKRTWDGSGVKTTKGISKGFVSCELAL